MFCFLDNLDISESDSNQSEHCSESDSDSNSKLSTQVNPNEQTVNLATGHRGLHSRGIDKDNHSQHSFRPMQHWINPTDTDFDIYCLCVQLVCRSSLHFIRGRSKSQAGSLWIVRVGSTLDQSTQIIEKLKIIRKWDFYLFESLLIHEKSENSPVTAPWAPLTLFL